MGVTMNPSNSGHSFHITDGIWLKNGNVSGLSTTDVKTLENFSVQCYYPGKHCLFLQSMMYIVTYTGDILIACHFFLLIRGFSNIP